MSLDLSRGCAYGLKGRANHSRYQAAKGGAVMITRSLAKEFAAFGVRVNSLCPVA